MAASGISTVATCLPLFATKTVILNRFAAVLSVTMGIGLLYVLLFLAPMMGMFGPLVTKTRAPVTASVLSRSMTVLLNSKAVRFILVCIFALVTLVRPTFLIRPPFGSMISWVATLFLDRQTCRPTNCWTYCWGCSVCLLCV